MFTKFIAKRFIENLIKEATKQLPELADKIKNDVLLHRDEIINCILVNIKQVVIDLFKKRFGK